VKVLAVFSPLLRKAASVSKQNDFLDVKLGFFEKGGERREARGFFYRIFWKLLRLFE
jgi:hypothetical protein